MPSAARLSDPNAHGTPLGAGPGSPNVRIGGRPAWRALPAGPVGASVEAAAGAIAGVMSAALLNPASAAAQLAQIQASLQKAALDASTQGNPAAPPAAGGAIAALNATNTALATAWAAASAVPGGEPSASQAYTKGLQAAVSAAAGSIFSAIGGMADLHKCPMPCAAGVHGPGMVTAGSRSVRINGLPAVRQGDKVVEACGGSDPITAGCATVRIDR